MTIKVGNKEYRERLRLAQQLQQAADELFSYALGSTTTKEPSGQSAVCDKKGECSRCDENRNRPPILVEEVEGKRYVCTQIADFYTSSGRIVPIFAGKWGDCPNHEDFDEVFEHINYCASNHEILGDFCKIIEKLKLKEGN